MTDVTDQQFVMTRGVRKVFGDFEALRGIDVDLRRGGVTCIMGPSGSGKSTFLRCLNHLESIDGGTILIDGEFVGYERRGDVLHELKPKEVARRRASIGMVFQRFNLFPHKTALENVIEAPIGVKGIKRADAVERGHNLLERVGLADRAGHYPSELSGGQQQRVAIARALAMDPKLLLFDEPTSALDPELVSEVLAVIRALTETGITMVVVTHEVGFARECADTTIFMENGLIVEHGDTRGVLTSPEHGRTAAFLKSVL